MNFESHVYLVSIEKIIYRNQIAFRKFKVGLSSAFGGNFTYEFTFGGTFELCLMAYNTFPICANTLCKTIVIGGNLSIIISNLLTPNGDGKNDAWFIANIGKIDGCSVFVFNRWGVKLFETTNYNND